MATDPFCSSEAVSRTIVYETEHFMALYDIKPVVSGHCMIIPKRHITDPMEMREDEWDEFHVMYKAIVPTLLRIYSDSANSYDVVSQIGPYSGRTVPHLHFHILPRRKGDRHGNVNIYTEIEENKANFDMEHVKAQVALLRKEFGYSARPQQR